jgi:RNase P subunit RPR2
MEFMWLIMIFFIGIALYAQHQAEQAKKEGWRKFASANNLTFTAGSFLGSNAQVSGNYRGHYLELVTLYQNKQTFTRLTLYPGNRQIGKTLALTDQDIPDEITVGTITNWLAPDRLGAAMGQIKTAPRGHSIYCIARNIVTDSHVLTSNADLLSKIAAGYSTILALGGEAVPALEAMANSQGYLLRDVAKQLLRDIAEQTRHQLGHRADRLLCPDCLTWFSAHQVRLPWWQSITYYGCRSCGQSRKFLLDDVWVVLLLDNQVTWPQFIREKLLYINWSAQHRLVDFDEVQIAAATDEEVERLAVQVGNDTDPLRKGRYPHMRCTISAGCNLSENTLRILRRMFGQVEVKKEGQVEPSTVEVESREIGEMA